MPMVLFGISLRCDFPMRAFMMKAAIYPKFYNTFQLGNDFFFFTISNSLTNLVKGSAGELDLSAFLLWYLVLVGNGDLKSS